MLSEVCLIHRNQLSRDICLYFLKPFLKHKLQQGQNKPWLPHSFISLRSHILFIIFFTLSFSFFSIRKLNGHATYTHINLKIITLKISLHIISYFVSYVKYCSDNLKPFLMNLPKLNRSIKSFEKVKYVLILATEKHQDILYKYSGIWGRIKGLLEKDLEVEVIYKNKYIITKIKSHKNEN